MTPRFHPESRRDRSAGHGLRGGTPALAIAALASLLSFTPARACKDDLPKVGYLGITELDCNCSSRFQMHSNDGQHFFTRSWVFRSEPVIAGIDDDGPAAGKLKVQDVITAVNGSLITTGSGSERFSRIKPGDEITLTIRRDGREMPVRMTVGSICPEELSGSFSMSFLPTPPVPPSGSSAPAPPEAPPPPRGMWMEHGRGMGRSLELPNASPAAMPRGWLGVGFNCNECGGQLPDSSTIPVWSFSTLPTIYFVDPDGPAGHAGLRRGDVLTKIDGLSLLTDEGGRRFGAMKPGQVVSWTLLRDGAARTVSVTATDRPGDGAAALEAYRQSLDALREMRHQREDLNLNLEGLENQLRVLERFQVERVPSGPRRLRYAGSVAGSDIEVRGLGSVVVDDSGGGIVITTRDATIRIRPSAKNAAAKSATAKNKTDKSDTPDRK